MAAYQAFETQLFTEQLEAVGDKQARQQILDVYGRLTDHPELNDGPLEGNRSGTFKKKAAQKKYRIIFRYCEHCLRTKKCKCEDCISENFPDKSIIFMELIYRRDGY